MQIKKISFITCIIFTMVFTACSNNGKQQPGAADSTFSKLSENFITGYLAARPEQGVALGLHEYDGKTTDYSKANLDSELARLKDFDQLFAIVDTAALSTKMFYDYRILRSAIKTEIFRFEDLGIFTKTP